MSYLHKSFLNVLLMVALPLFPAHGGGWDLDVGPEIMTIQGKLVCMGCSLKKTSGSNSQCGIYTAHTIGLRMGDSSLWSFVNNDTGHDVIFAHDLLEGKKAKVTGFLYPMAHMIELLSVEVEGVGEEQIKQAAWQEDQRIARALLSRKPGEAPVVSRHGAENEVDAEKGAGQ